MNIYEIAQEHLRLLEIVEENDGDLTPELEQELMDILATGDDKLEAFYHVYRNLKANLVGIESEYKRIGDMKKSVTANMDRIKTTLDSFMRVTGRDRYENGAVKMIMAKKTDFSYDVFPKEFIESVTTEKEKLAEFKAWAKENPDTALELCGAKFTEGKSIQIK